MGRGGKFLWASAEKAQAMTIVDWRAAMLCDCGQRKDSVAGVGMWGGVRGFATEVGWAGCGAAVVLHDGPPAVQDGRPKSTSPATGSPNKTKKAI